MTNTYGGEPKGFKVGLTNVIREHIELQGGFRQAEEDG